MLGQIGLNKQCSPRTDCSLWSSLIRVYTVCYSIPTFLDAFWQCKTIPLHFYNNYGFHDSVPIFRILRYFVEEYIKAFSEFWHLLSYEPLQLCLIYATMKSKLNVISLKPAMLNVRHYRLKAYFAVKQALNQSRTNRLEVNALFKYF